MLGRGLHQSWPLHNRLLSAKTSWHLRPNRSHQCLQRLHHRPCDVLLWRLVRWRHRERLHRLCWRSCDPEGLREWFECRELDPKSTSVWRTCFLPFRLCGDGVLCWLYRSSDLVRQRSELRELETGESVDLPVSPLVSLCLTPLFFFLSGCDHS
jgi:hypothetical protein